MKILSWNVNGLHERLDPVNRSAQIVRPDIMCFQRVRSKDLSLIMVPVYMSGWGHWMRACSWRVNFFNWI